MDFKDPDKEKFQANRTKGRLELDGPSARVFEKEEKLEEGWESAGFSLPKWLVLLAGIAGVVVVAVITYRIAGNSPVDRQNIEAEKGVDEEPNFMERATTQEIHLAVEKTVRGFMNASSHQERCRFIIGGDKLGATLEQFYSRPKTAPPQSFGKIHTKKLGAFSGIPMYAVFATEAHRKSGTFLNLLPTHSGMAIDWESSVGFGEISWLEFAESKPLKPTLMRVFLEMIPYDARNPDIHLRAYCEISVRGSSLKHLASFPRDSEVATQLTEFAAPGTIQPVCAKIRWIDQGASVEISEIVHNYWIDIRRYQKFIRSESTR